MSGQKGKVRLDDLPVVADRPLEGEPGADDPARWQEIAEQVDRRLDLLERTEARAGDSSLLDRLFSTGLTRRDFIRWSSMMTATLMLPPLFEPRVARAAALSTRVPVVWINLADCDGNTESLLRTGDPDFATVILDTISLDYNETVMAPAGAAAEARLEEVLQKERGNYIAMFEGALPTGLNGAFLTLGSKGETGLSLARRVASGAKAVVAVGTCATFGGIPAAGPNPTGAKGVGEALGIPVINISGCPANATNIVGTLLDVVMFGRMPALDQYSRPLWAYGRRIHDNCERRGHFDAGEYVLQWGDAGAEQGWCLFKMGCKGPYTFNNCSLIRWNQGTSWPVRAGHGCIGCSEPAFWDSMTPFEQPLGEKVYGSAAGIGIDAKANTVGEWALGIAAAGIAAHAVATSLRNRLSPAWAGSGAGPDGQPKAPTHSQEGE
ncbi:MAG: hydrogenase small subunit [Bacillota bacterium]|nr:hydrogenase small subunit [Bacillota bacterium]